MSVDDIDFGGGDWRQGDEVLLGFGRLSVSGAIWHLLPFDFFWVL